jgi:signal transduction histidine kinase/ligand-binding sensor domain-containing protein
VLGRRVICPLIAPEAAQGRDYEVPFPRRPCQHNETVKCVRWFWRGLVLAALALGLEPAAWAGPKLLLEDLSVRTWTKEEGLPDNSVTAVLQTRDGYFWVGTMGGLARFDGVRFVVFAPVPARSNEVVRVSALFEDSVGRLWVGSQGEGLLCYADGVVRRFAGNPGLCDQTITSIAEDAAGTLWVGTPLGLNCLKGEQVDRFTVKDGLPNDFVSSVHFSRSGVVWITTSGGMCQYKEGQLLPLPLETDIRGRSPLYLGVYEDRQGNQWAYGDTYLVRIDKQSGEGRRLNYFHSGDTSSMRIWSLCEGSRGQLWIGTSRQGLYCFTDDKLVQLTLREGQLPGDVRALFEDREGDLWLGTDGGGLVRLQPRSVRMLDAHVGLPGGPAVCLAFGPAGQSWVGFEHGGLYSGSVDRFEPGTADGGLGLQNLVSCLGSAGSTLWVGTLGAGLYSIRGPRVLHFTTADGLADDTILALAAEPDGAVWAGTRSGVLHRLTWGRGTGLSAAGALSGDPITALLPAREGGIWVGTADGGVWRFARGQFRRWDGTEALAGKAVRALYEDASGHLWIGTAGNQLACVAGGRCWKWFEEPRSVEDSVTGILGCENGDLWFATGRGINRVTGSETKAWLAGQSALRPQVFFETEAPAQATMAHGWPRALRAPDGRFWFATAAGVVTFDPLGLEPEQAPPPVRLEAILVNDQALNLAALGVSGGRGREQRPPWPSADGMPLQLPAKLRSLEIQYTAFCFAAPDRVRFRHKLEGFDADWGEPTNERRVRYGRLPNGTYRFRVMSCSAAGVWNEADTGFDFVIPAPAWRSWWALGLYGVAATGLVAGTARLVSYRRLRRRLARLAQEQAMQRERMRIAQDMHDEIGSKLAKISYISERAKGELQDHKPVAGRLEAIANTSRDLLQSLDEIVWAVNPHNDTLEHLAAYLGQYVTEYLQNTALQCELHIPRSLPHQPLSAEVRHNLFLAFEEALSNALKHGGASHVRVAMATGPSGFEITVTDNGCGFDAAAAEHTAEAGVADRTRRGGNGLWNMRQRLADVGGQCTVSSRGGGGTTVMLSVPLGAENVVKI